MKVWSVVFNFISGFILVIIAMSLFNFTQVCNRDFDQVRYNYAVRQATEAMFLSTLSSEDLDMDYANVNYVTINSSEALHIYDRVMCFNYGLSPSEENFTDINQTLAACVLAGYDGYYIAEMVGVDSIDGNGVLTDGYDLKFSPKIPYYLETESTLYAIDTYLNTWMSVSKINHNAKPVLNTVPSLPAGFTKEQVNSAINTQIRAAILNELSNTNNARLEDLKEFRLFFPDNTTVTGVNPIQVPSIFVMATKADFASQYDISAMSTSGYKVISLRKVIAFTDKNTGRSYYCYESQLRDEEKTANSGGIATGGTYGSFEIENYFDSIQDAASAVSPTTGQNYSPYYDIMARKVQDQQF